MGGGLRIAMCCRMFRKRKDLRRNCRKRHSARLYTHQVYKYRRFESTCNWLVIYFESKRGQLVNKHVSLHGSVTRASARERKREFLGEVLKDVGFPVRARGRVTRESSWKRRYMVLISALRERERTAKGSERKRRDERACFKTMEDKPEAMARAREREDDETRRWI